VKSGTDILGMLGVTFHDIRMWTHFGFFFVFVVAW
jgi:hypothetical protein